MLHSRRFAAAFLAGSLALAMLTPRAGYALSETQKASLNRLVSAEIRRDALADASWGVLAIDSATNEVLFNYNATQALMPASNRKLFSTAFALTSLGADFRFKTTIERTGTVNANGVLAGHLILRASGDPTITESVLANLASQVQAAGIRQVSGDLLVDVTCFRDTVCKVDGWSDDYEASYYAALPCAFSVNDNVANVRVSPGSASGAPGRISVTPDSEFLKIINRTRTVSQGSTDITIKHDDAAGALTVSGTISRRTGSETNQAAVPDPARFAAGVFKRNLQRKGIRLTGSTRLVPSNFAPPAAVATMASYSSPPLSQILQDVNQDSNNFMAEMIYLAAGRAGTDQPASYDLSRMKEKAFWERCGLSDSNTMYAADGCGLSRLNRFTPRAFCELLRYMNTQPQRDAYLGSLSVNGKVGTLKSRMAEEPYRARVHGKTGFISSVSCLSGYARDLQNHTVIFSILVNGFTCDKSTVKSAQDRICKRLIDLPNSGAVAVSAAR